VPVTLIATTNIADNDAGLASGLINTSQQLGGALGLAVLSTLAANSTATALAHLGAGSPASARVAAVVGGFRLAFFVGAGLLLAGSVLLATLLRREHVALIDAPPAAEALAA